MWTSFSALELEEREEKLPSEDLTSEAKTGEEEPEVIYEDKLWPTYKQNWITFKYLGDLCCVFGL